MKFIWKINDQGVCLFFPPAKLYYLVVILQQVVMEPHYNQYWLLEGYHFNGFNNQLLHLQRCFEKARRYTQKLSSNPQNANTTGNKFVSDFSNNCSIMYERCTISLLACTEMTINNKIRILQVALVVWPS